VVFEVHAASGVTLRLTKWLGYHHGAEGAADLADRVELTLRSVRSGGCAGSLVDHQRDVRDSWNRGEVVLEGAPAGQQAFHFSLFTLLQASSRNGRHGIPAKGMTGTGYEGRYVWDTEVYVLSFLIHMSSEVARDLLMTASECSQPLAGARGRLGGPVRGLLL
jgi:alpha,alpha-trehalose phosphorylase